MNTSTPAPIAAYAAIRETTAHSHREAGATIGEFDLIQHPDTESFFPVYLRVTGAHTDNDTRILSTRMIDTAGAILPARMLITLPTDTIVTVWNV